MVPRHIPLKERRKTKSVLSSIQQDESIMGTTILSTEIASPLLKKRHKLSNAVDSKHQSSQLRFTENSVSSMLNPLKNENQHHRLAAADSTKVVMHRKNFDSQPKVTSTSMQQLSRIERTSQRQLSTMAKLQSKLIKTNDALHIKTGRRHIDTGMNLSQKGFGRGSGRHIPVQRIEHSAQQLTRLPKKVQILDDRHQQQNRNASMSLLSANDQNAYKSMLAQPAFAVKRRSILKQSFNANISTISHQSNAQDSSNYQIISGRNTYHKRSKSTMKAPSMV